MTIKEYLADKELIAIEVIDSLIINLVTVGDLRIGLKVDTSSIPAYTPLVKTTEFTLTETELTYEDTTLDINVVEVLFQTIKEESNAEQ